jgi:ethanolamine ammonia-lyase large subunit
MAGYAITLGQACHHFADLKQLLARATPARAGDRLAGIAARPAEERVAAQMALADLPLRRFLDEAVVPYENDEITRLIIDTHDRAAFAPAPEFEAWLASMRLSDGPTRLSAPDGAHALLGLMPP